MSIIGVRGIEKTSPEFRRRLVEVSNNLGLNPDVLATIISFETGNTFRSDIRSPTGCVGLIQFCKAAASEAAEFTGRKMSGSDAQDWLATMTPEQQLTFVENYFKTRIRGRKGLTLAQAYLIVFAPACAFRAPDAACYTSGTEEYARNSGMDVDGDGKITVADVTRKINALYDDGRSRPRVSSGGEFLAAGLGGPVGGPGLVMLGIGGLLGWYVVSTYFKKGIV